MNEIQREDVIQLMRDVHRLAAKAEVLESELERLRHDYALFEEMAPPDVPRQEFVRWCYDAWEEKCEREAVEAKEGNHGKRYASIADLLEACEFSHGAIMDAIGLEDGLDGADGEAVLELLERAMPELKEIRIAKVEEPYD